MNSLLRLARDQWRPLLLGFGALLSLIALTANWLGLGRSPEFGEKQVWLLGMGLLSLLLSRLPRPPMDRSRPSFRPTAAAFFAASLGALLIIAVDTALSLRFGLLAYPPYHDGISSMLAAKSLFYQFTAAWEGHRPFAETKFYNSILTPLWQSLMLLHFLLLGEGEWQAYAVRFWPIFLLLLLTMWFVERRAAMRIAVLATLLTGMLPTISVTAYELVKESFPSVVNFGTPWYLGDLRPDLLFAALLLWTIVPLLEPADEPDWRLSALTGLSAALAVMVKASASPILLLGWSLAMGCVLVRDPRHRRANFSMILWSLLVFQLILTPWVVAGGLDSVMGYLRAGLFTKQAILWSTPNPTLLSEFTYYWTLFPAHMGSILGNGVLAAGATALLFSGSRLPATHRNPIELFLVVAALYTLCSLTPNRNFFLGLSYYFLLWLCAWGVLAPVLSALAQRHRTIGHMCLVVPCLYALWLAGGAGHAAFNWPDANRRAAAHARDVTIRIAGALRATLSPHDKFLVTSLYGYPDTLQYYMMDRAGSFPDLLSVDLLDSFSRVKPIILTYCKVVLVPEHPEMLRLTSLPKPAWPFVEALMAWIGTPESGYRLAASYDFFSSSRFSPPPDAPGENYPDVRLMMYVRD